MRCRPTARAAGNTKDNAYGNKRADKSGAREPPAAKSQHNTCQRTDGCATREAENIGIGERVAQQHLHKNARERERCACDERGQGAREPDILEHLTLQIRKVT